MYRLCVGCVRCQLSRGAKKGLGLRLSGVLHCALIADSPCFFFFIPVRQREHAATEANGDCCSDSSRAGSVKDATVSSQPPYVRTNNEESGSCVTSRSVFLIFQVCRKRPAVCQ